MDNRWLYTVSGQPAFYTSGNHYYNAQTHRCEYFQQDNWIYEMGGQPAFFIQSNWVYTAQGRPAYYFG